MTYEQRLRQIAEEMAEEFNNSQFAKTLFKMYGIYMGWQDLPQEEKDALIKIITPLAEIAIRREGEMFDEGWTGALNMVCEPSAPDRDITKHDLGLIKPTTDGTEAR